MVIAFRYVVFNILDILECASDPCLNGGTCNDEIGYYTCTCLEGYTGDRCETSMPTIALYTNLHFVL